MKKIFILIFCIFFFTGCKTVKDFTRSSTSPTAYMNVGTHLYSPHGPVRVQVAGTRILHDVGQGAVFYIALDIDEEFSGGKQAVFEFENPCANKGFLRVEKMLVPGQKKLLVESPPFLCLQPKRIYIIDVSFFDSAEGGKPVFSFRQEVDNTLDLKAVQEQAYKSYRQ